MIVLLKYFITFGIFLFAFCVLEHQMCTDAKSISCHDDFHEQNNSSLPVHESSHENHCQDFCPHIKTTFYQNWAISLNTPFVLTKQKLYSQKNLTEEIFIAFIFRPPIFA